MPGRWRGLGGGGVGWGCVRGGCDGGWVGLGVREEAGLGGERGVVRGAGVRGCAGGCAVAERGGGCWDRWALGLGEGRMRWLFGGVGGWLWVERWSWGGLRERAGGGGGGGRAWAGVASAVRRWEPCLVRWRRKLRVGFVAVGLGWWGCSGPTLWARVEGPCVRVYPPTPPPPPPPPGGGGGWGQSPWGAGSVWGACGWRDPPCWGWLCVLGGTRGWQHLERIWGVGGGLRVGGGSGGVSVEGGVWGWCVLLWGLGLGGGLLSA
jgi:hypothetical protein